MTTGPQGQSAEKDVFAFCEPVSATERTKEHIRLVGTEGFKYGGGIPNAALCGRDVRKGWDLRVPVHPARFMTNTVVNPTCEKCIDAYFALTTPPTSGDQR